VIWNESQSMSRTVAFREETTLPWSTPSSARAWPASIGCLHDEVLGRLAQIAARVEQTLAPEPARGRDGAGAPARDLMARLREVASRLGPEALAARRPGRPSSPSVVPEAPSGDHGMIRPG